jgi:hypothetical protein
VTVELVTEKDVANFNRYTAEMDFATLAAPDAEGEGGTGEEGDTEDSRAAQLQTILAATRQKQVETCLRFRTFATRTYVSRLRLLRCFYGLVRLYKYNQSHRVRVLCGDEEKARIKLKLIMARLLVCKLEQAYDAWQAKQGEQPLVEDEMRARLRGDKDPTHNSQGVLFGGAALADPEHKFSRFWDKENARKYKAFLRDLNGRDPAPIAMGGEEVR